MYELIPVIESERLPAPERSLTFDDSIIVDVERCILDSRTSFTVNLSGKQIREIHFYPKNDGHWQFILGGGVPGYSLATWCCGYGPTPSDAIKDAFKGGLADLNKAVAYAKRIKERMRKKGAVVSLGQKKEGA